MEKKYKLVNGERVEWSLEDYAQLEADKESAAAALAAYGYVDKRATEYPSIVDQLDIIYHRGIDAWKAEIATIKAKYPKPQ